MAAEVFQAREETGRRLGTYAKVQIRKEFFKTVCLRRPGHDARGNQKGHGAVQNACETFGKYA